MTTDPRPITAVRFHTQVVLGSVDQEGWYADKPASSYMAGKITPRPGNADIGEQRSSIVFEVRLGGPNGNVDVEVPASNLAMVIRKTPEKPTGVPPGVPAGGKK